MRVTATLVLGTVSLTIMLTEFNEGGESICAEDFFSNVLKVLRFNLSCQLCRHHAVEFCRAYQRNRSRIAQVESAPQRCHKIQDAKIHHAMDELEDFNYKYFIIVEQAHGMK